MKIKKKCKCGKSFWIYPYREKSVRGCSRSCAAKFATRPKGYKSPKGSLAKMGDKNPMYGKKFTKEHCKKISKSVIKFFTENPDKFKLRGQYGNKNPRWAGDNIGRYGVHDWIERIKGKAYTLRCELKDKTCKGRLEWSNKSQKYLRRIYDWRVLCDSHHGRYDKHTWKNGLKTRFKKGQIPWNKK